MGRRDCLHPEQIDTSTYIERRSSPILLDSYYGGSGGPRALPCKNRCGQAPAYVGRLAAPIQDGMERQMTECCRRATGYEYD